MCESHTNAKKNKRNMYERKLREKKTSSAAAEAVAATSAAMVVAIVATTTTCNKFIPSTQFANAFNHKYLVNTLKHTHTRSTLIEFSITLWYGMVWLMGNCNHNFLVARL